MYRQITLHPDHRHFQRIFWQFSEDEPISIFYLNTVTYGVVPSAYQVLRSIRQFYLDEYERFPLVINYPKENM